MNKAGKQASIAVGVVIVVAAIGWYLWQKGGWVAPPTGSAALEVRQPAGVTTSKSVPGVAVGEWNLNDPGFYPTFTTLASAEGALTEPKETHAGGEKGEMLTKTYSLSISEKGFDPQTIVVKKGDFVQISFSATDGEYDLAVARPIGAYLDAKKGETKPFGFTAVTSGVYPFACRLMCPNGNEVRGEIVVQ